ncbi:MAG: sporulation protein YqfD [Clostridia bacterium]|nr:sporulation protein YqfD [Clostridia bacterium]
MLYNALRGTVQIQITGGWPEQFLSGCAREGIQLWDARHLREDCFTAWVSAADYFRLRGQARRTGTRLHILEKRGVPFWAHRMLRRKVLWVTALLCLVGIWYLSGFVWTISVTGCEEMTQREVLELLEKHGLRFGTRVRSIDGDLIRNDVLQDTDKLTYLVVDVHGTHADIRVMERDAPPDLEALAEPCDVVSEGTGIIQALRVQQGTSLVKIGDVVQTGDRLASGIVRDAQGGETRVHALAEADILTRRVLRAAVPGSPIAYQQTGMLQVRRYLVLGGCKIPLNIVEKNAFPWYDKILEIKSLVLRKDFRFDVGLAVERHMECSTAPGTLDLAALEDALQRRMEAAYAAAYPTAQVQKKTFRMEEQDGAYIGTLELETVETVGIIAPLEEEIISGTDR